MEILRQETDEEHWGCANRIVNGRAVCDTKTSCTPPTTQPWKP